MSAAGERAGAIGATSVDVAIVGAGPAGMRAAIALADAGLRPLVVDERQAAGGQIYRQPPPELTLDAGKRTPVQRRGDALIAAARGRDVAWRFDTTAWGLFAHDDAPHEAMELALAGPGGTETVRARRVLVAPGAYDLPLPLPGWTLPGVMSAGGIQTFLKSQALLPGRRFLLSGSHPFTLLVADQLVAAGADVAGVALAQRPTPALLAQAAWGSLPHLRKAGELTPALRRLRRARVPLHLGRIVREAVGEDAVEAAVLTAVDRDWRPVPGSEQRVACDTIGLGYGFLCSSELTRQAGAEHEWRFERGGWIARHDHWMRTSLAPLYVAGEITGISGAEGSALEGELAAVGILRGLGVLTHPEAERAASPLRRARAGVERFAELVARLSTPPLSALVAGADDATLACRCEEVTFGEVRATLAAPDRVSTASAVKLRRRTGMGLCQGRFCSHTVAQLVADVSDRPPDRAGAFKPRVPVRPVPLAQLADAWDRELAGE